MRFLVVLAAFVLAVNAVADHEEWQQFKQKFGREYRNLREEQKRFSIFQDNLRTIEAHNELYAKGEKTYYMGVTQFADKTVEEFRSLLNNSANAKPAHPENAVPYQVTGVQVPNSINWVSKGVVTGIKDQQDCGSCWTFGTTGVVEGAYARKYGNLVSFSEQNILDCSTVEDPCEGGWQTAAYDYIKNNGIETEGDYPYQAKQGACKFSSSKSVTRVANYVILTQYDEGVLKEAVGSVGPISISVDANQFPFYSGGVFNEPSCSSMELNHAVLAVGYGKADGLDYWLVKNSWGLNWGDKGYIKIARNHNNMCGVASDGTYPNLV